MHKTSLRRLSLGLVALVASSVSAQTPVFSNKTMVFLQFGKKPSDLAGTQSDFTLVTRTGLAYGSGQIAALLPNKQLVITDIVVSGRRASLAQYKEGVGILLATTQGTLPTGGSYKYPYSAMSLNFPAASMEATAEQHFTSGLVFTAPDLPFFRFHPADGSHSTPAGMENDFTVFAYGYLLDK